MAKVITFSRQYPAKHKRAGQPTFFVEKLKDALFQLHREGKIVADYTNFNFQEHQEIIDLWPHADTAPRKFHTIRAGNRFKKGDYFSPRCWIGKPYRSKQLILHPDVLITDVWDVSLNLCPDRNHSFLDVLSLGDRFFLNETQAKIISELAMNDGLEEVDFVEWFKTEFTGQIICWNPDINYDKWKL